MKLTNWFTSNDQRRACLKSSATNENWNSHCCLCSELWTFSKNFLVSKNLMVLEKSRSFRVWSFWEIRPWKAFLAPFWKRITCGTYFMGRFWRRWFIFIFQIILMLSEKYLRTFSKLDKKLVFLFMYSKWFKSFWLFCFFKVRLKRKKHC